MDNVSQTRQCLLCGPSRRPVFSTVEHSAGNTVLRKEAMLLWIQSGAAARDEKARPIFAHGQFWCAEDLLQGRWQGATICKDIGGVLQYECAALLRSIPPPATPPRLITDGLGPHDHVWSACVSLVLAMLVALPSA
jgi:hypothetical protein